MLASITPHHRSGGVALDRRTYATVARVHQSGVEIDTWVQSLCYRRTTKYNIIYHIIPTIIYYIHYCRVIYVVPTGTYLTHEPVRDVGAGLVVITLRGV